MTPGILCPHCGHDDSRITDTRKVEGGNLRYRICHGCSGTFSTDETVRSSNEPIRPRASRAVSLAKFRHLTPEDVMAEVAGLPEPIVANLLIWWDEARWSKWRTSAVWTRRAFAATAARIVELYQSNPDLACRLVEAGTTEGWQTLKLDYLGPSLVVNTQRPAADSAVSSINSLLGRGAA